MLKKERSKSFSFNLKMIFIGMFVMLAFDCFSQSWNSYRFDKRQYVLIGCIRENDCEIFKNKSMRLPEVYVDCNKLFVLGLKRRDNKRFLWRKEFITERYFNRKKCNCK
jgi:hypothetical protein